MGELLINVNLFCNTKDSEILRYKYNKINLGFSQKLIYHVGTEAGVFSELNNMLYAMVWCLDNKIQFVLYADDANFTGGMGWNELFESFCEQNHDRLNRLGNYRKKGHFRYKRILLPNLFFRRFLFPHIIKKRNHNDYLTQDIFSLLRKSKALYENVSIDEFGINGVLREEFVKLSPVALNIKEEIVNEIIKNIERIDLPKRYISIQIRGGDKIVELSKEYDAFYCSEFINKYDGNKDNIFVFTDDYKNVDSMKELFPSSKIYTLTKATERGYYNEEFNSLEWSIKKAEIVKLLSMVVICLNSEMHFGYSGTCIDDFIRNSLDIENYTDMGTYSPIPRNLRYYFYKFMKRR